MRKFGLDLDSDRRTRIQERRILYLKVFREGPPSGWTKTGLAESLWAMRDSMQMPPGDTDKEVRAILSWGTAPGNLEPPPFSLSQRMLISDDIQAGFALLLGRVEWFFEAACQMRLPIRVCDLCGDQVFLIGRYQGRRKDCDSCQKRIDPVARSRKRTKVVKSPDPLKVRR